MVCRVFVLRPVLEEKPRRLHHVIREKQALGSSIVDHDMQGSAFHASELLSCETLIGWLLTTKMTLLRKEAVAVSLSIVVLAL